MNILHAVKIKDILLKIGCVSIIALMVLASGCGTPQPKAKAKTKKSARQTVGMASYYGGKFHGRRTASGERFNMYALTAAHRKLPFGTLVRVTNLNNKRSVKVRINDRGPFIKGRIIDLSYAAAKKIGMLKKGVVKVRITVLK